MSHQICHQVLHISLILIKLFLPLSLRGYSSSIICSLDGSLFLYNHHVNRHFWKDVYAWWGEEPFVQEFILLELSCLHSYIAPRPTHCRTCNLQYISYQLRFFVYVKLFLCARLRNRGSWLFSAQHSTLLSSSQLSRTERLTNRSRLSELRSPKDPLWLAVYT